MRKELIIVATVAALTGCGAPETPIDSTDEALCVIKPHCGPCNPDPSSPTGGTKQCYQCDGESYPLECKPVCTHQVRNVAGSVLLNPYVIPVYWGKYFTTNYPGGYGDSVFHEATWNTLATSTQFWNRMSEYGVGVGKYSGGYYTNAGLSANISDAAIRGELINETVGTTGGLPSPIPYGNVIYVIYLPNGVRSTRNVDGGHTGYHDSILVGNSTNIYYAVVDGVGSPAQVDIIATHEVEEAATDAILGRGFNEVNNPNGEIADLCAPRNETISGREVPMVWSQAACGCK